MAKENAKAKAKSDKPNILIRFGRKVKEIFSELKRVTWPSFGKIVKTTGVVLLVVLFFLVVYTAADFGLGKLLELAQKVQS